MLNIFYFIIPFYCSLNTLLKSLQVCFVFKITVFDWECLRWRFIKTIHIWQMSETSVACKGLGCQNLNTKQPCKLLLYIKKLSKLARNLGQVYATFRLVP